MSVSVSRHERRADGSVRTGCRGKGVRGGACTAPGPGRCPGNQRGVLTVSSSQLQRGGKKPLALDPGNSGA